ncbi:hypothetical protein [Roseovarius confluentis]|uniref:hypothetical protein n=1 Tax=Roseovarius confluentis TaxID=1852027 RepID=UPI003BAB3D34
MTLTLERFRELYLAERLNQSPPRADIGDFDTFLSECVANWIAARLHDRVVEPAKIAETCQRHVGAKVSDHREEGWPIVTFMLAGLSGQARCLHGALTDWLDQWQQTTGRRI